MKGHCVRLKRVHRIHHVLPLGVIAGVAPMPCIAPIQQKRIRAIRAHGFDHCCDPVQPPDTAIFSG